MAEQPADSEPKPSLPKPRERMEVTTVAAPHPAVLDPDVLSQQCTLRTQRRSGPGGQHRNKTSSGVFLHHESSNVVGEATERRSQADNRSIALQRLRFRLAVELRTPSVIDGADSAEEAELRERYSGTSLRLAEDNPAKPAVLALLLNDLHGAGGQPSAVAPIWKSSTSAVVRLIKSHGPAFQLLNAIRGHHGRPPLK